MPSVRKYPEKPIRKISIKLYEEDIDRLNMLHQLNPDIANCDIFEEALNLYAREPEGATTPAPAISLQARNTPPEKLREEPEQTSKNPRSQAKAPII
jgi:hypothetical protein